MRNVDFRQEGFDIRDASAGTEFSIDPQRIVLKKIDARILRGTVTGSAEVKHYAPALETVGPQLSAEKPTKAAKPSANAPAKSANASGKASLAPVQQGSANLKVAGASSSEVDAHVVE